MRLLQYTLGPVQTNCYVIAEGDRCLVIDPGDSGDQLALTLCREKLVPEAVLLTHGHFDHVGGVEDFIGAFPGIPVYILEEEMPLMRDPQMNLSSEWALAGKDYSSLVTDTFRDGDEKKLAGMTFKVIATPGHTPGSCSYFFPEEGVLFPGDTLFRLSAGRCDLPGGSAADEVRSIREKLFTLPPETKVYPGHEDSTTISFEKANNPYA